MSTNPFDPTSRCAECGGLGTRLNPNGSERGCDECYPHWPGESEVGRDVRAKVLTAAQTPLTDEMPEFAALATGSLVAAFNRQFPDLRLAPTTTAPSTRGASA